MIPRNEHQRFDNFLFHCMTQSEQALHGQDPGRMAEALRSILQGAYDLHAARSRSEAADTLARTRSQGSTGGGTALRAG